MSPISLFARSLSQHILTIFVRLPLQEATEIRDFFLSDQADPPDDSDEPPMPAPVSAPAPPTPVLPGAPAAMAAGLQFASGGGGR
jgi:hypothetical protein